MTESVGQLFVLSGPSGAGKSTVRQRVREIFPELEYSISHTTRAPRKGESDGEDYHFVSPREFDAMMGAGAFVEWAEVHGSLYGTSRDQLERIFNNQREILLEIDVQGARQVKAHFPQACFIFLLPPSWEALEERLRLRGTELGADGTARLENAPREVLEAPWYDYLIVNDNLEEAVKALAAIILSTRFRQQIVLPRVLNLLQPIKQ